MLASRVAVVCTLILPLFAQRTSAQAPVKTLFIKPFTTSSNAEELRRDVISELRHLTSVSVVSDEAKADAILIGGGEIWVRGYVSLNPRSGRLPSDGRPVYDGYVSVELTDAKGQTFWSYLATPSSGVNDVRHDLAKTIARHLAEALQKGDPIAQTGHLPEPSTLLTAAGATFPAPIYDKWFGSYRRENPKVEISYSAIGSEAGVKRLLAGEVDFGASDSPEAIQDLAPDRQGQFLLFPSVVGAVVPVVNLPGLGGEISLSPEALAGIYLGKITKWNDPILERDNRRVHLPDLEIKVIHRSDGSGTSYAWTDYLSRADADWKQKVGVNLTPQWPVGKGVEGNEGVATQVKEFGGSIGYVEFIYALQNHMEYAKVRNRDGQFVRASLEGMQVAAARAPQMSADFKVSIVDAPGWNAYPISTFTWLVVPVQVEGLDKQRAITQFLSWMLGPGQLQSAALGYLALPQDVVQRERSAISRIRASASPSSPSTR